MTDWMYEHENAIKKLKEENEQLQRGWDELNKRFEKAKELIKLCIKTLNRPHWKDGISESEVEDKLREFITYEELEDEIFKEQK